MAPPLLSLPKPGAHIVEFGLQHDRFRLVKALSNGGQGEVHVCRRLNSGDDFAVKIINRRALQMSQRNEVLLRREIRTLRELQHRNVVALHDAFWEGGSCFIVMDLAREGDLREKVALNVGLGTDPTSSEYASKYASRQLVNGINYMHHRRVIHRDLKVENILVARCRPAPPPFSCQLHELQITDFGLSTWLDIVGEEMTPCGTPNYLAPEVMREDHMYDERVDFWSFGVILYILLCGDFPFAAYRHPAEAKQLEAKEVKASPGWLAVSELARAFTCGLLSFDPAERLSHGGCLRHPWLAAEAMSSAWADELEVVEPEALAAAPAVLDVTGAVASVSGWTGAAVDSIKLQCRDGSTQVQGYDGGWAEATYPLEPDECIIAVAQETRSGGANHLGNAVALYTSSCNVLEFAGADARTRQRFVAPLGSQIVGLQFVGSRLTGIHLAPVPEGGAAGLVEEVGGRCGYAVDHVWMRFRSGTTRRYGGPGGFEQGPWQLEPDEFIIVVEQARRESFLGNSVAFYTSTGNIFRLSGMEASVSRRFAVTAGHQICGLDFQDSLLVGVRTCSQQISRPQSHEVECHNVS